MTVRATLLGGLVAVTGLMTGACGDAEEPLQQPVGEIPPAAQPCLGFAPTLAPVTGEGPLHRTTALTAHWASGEVPVEFDVRANGHVVAGNTWVRSGYALFLPEQAYPADARVEWRFAACDVVKTGSFSTGALFSPIDVTEAVGRSFGFDLRALPWQQPEARSTVDGFVMRWHLAPTFVVDVVDVNLGHATIALAPGVIDDTGAVVRDLAQGYVEMDASLMQNPYLHLAAPELALTALDGPVTLRDLELVVGLDDGCFTDGRLLAVMDVRALEKQGKEPCARLMSLTGESCVPCDDGDDDAGCFFLSMEGISSVSSGDSSLPPRPLP